MLKKYIRSTSIVFIQVIMLVALLLLAPHLLQFQVGFNQTQHFLLSHKTAFLIIHIGLYLIFFWLWPQIVHIYSKRSNISCTSEQIHSALKAKWYLLTILIFIELMVWWKS